MRVNARLTRNTSISLGPVGWLIVGPVILAALFPILTLALAALLSALAVGLVVLAVYGVVLAVSHYRHS